MSIKNITVASTFAISIFLVGCTDVDSATDSNVSSAVKNAAESESVVAETTQHNMKVFKSPTCGCCQEWIDHAEENNIISEIHHPQNLPKIKTELGIGPQYRSCHTAVSQDGYIFEGHVPARLVNQFLTEDHPDALGLSVPGMPAGSPGMEMGDHFTPYQVLLLKKDGSYEVYAEVKTQQEQY